MGVSQTLLGIKTLFTYNFYLINFSYSIEGGFATFYLTYGLSIFSGRSFFTNLASPKPLQVFLWAFKGGFTTFILKMGSFTWKGSILILFIPSSLLGLEPFLNGLPQFLSSTEARGGGLEYSQPYGGPGFLR